MSEADKILVARALCTFMWPDHYPEEMKPRTENEFAELGRIARELDNE